MSYTFLTFELNIGMPVTHDLGNFHKNVVFPNTFLLPSFCTKQTDI